LARSRVGNSGIEEDFMTRREGRVLVRSRGEREGGPAFEHLFDLKFVELNDLLIEQPHQVLTHFIYLLLFPPISHLVCFALLSHLIFLFIAIGG
jgi:hypothetical protein